MFNLFRRSLVGKHAKEITGDAWFNITSLPREAQQAVLEHRALRFDTELSGIVTLVHFWDYSSPESIDDLAYLARWWELYEGDVFSIIGVHTPQYEFAKNADKVQAAAIRFHLDYPVVSDIEYATWKRYGCNVWPRKILVDATGIVRFDHSGKGGYDELEHAIQHLLEEHKEAGHIVPALHTVTPPISFDRNSCAAQGFAVSPVTDAAEYHISPKVALHSVALSGWWTMQEQELLSGPLSDEQSCVIHFFGSQCVAAMRSSSQDGASIQVFIDGKKFGDDIHVDSAAPYVLASNLLQAAHHLTIIPVQGSIAIASVSFS